MTYVDPRGKLLAHLPRLAMLQQGEIPPPVNIEADLSNRCQLGCVFCHFAHVHVRGPLAGTPRLENAVPGGDLMDVTLALRMIDQFAEAGVESISWTGGGEPLLHKGFDQIVTYAKAAGLVQGVYTNGVAITGAKAALLKETMRFVYVSLDAVDALSYQAHKGVDRFDAVCDSIERLVAADGDATIGVGFLLGEDNWQDVYRVGALIEDLGANYGQVRPIILFDVDEPGQPTGDLSWLDDAVTAIEEETAAYSCIEADVSRFTALRDWTGHGYPTCWWSGLQAVVTPSGKMFTCVNKREMGDALIGDLAVESFGEIWERRRIATVDGSCRVLCRGHVANLALTEIMAPRVHPEFV